MTYESEVTERGGKAMQGKTCEKAAQDIAGYDPGLRKWTLRSIANVITKLGDEAEAMWEWGHNQGSVNLLSNADAGYAMARQEMVAVLRRLYHMVMALAPEEDAKRRPRNLTVDERTQRTVYRLQEAALAEARRLMDELGHEEVKAGDLYDLARALQQDVASGLNQGPW